MTSVNESDLTHIFFDLICLKIGEENRVGDLTLYTRRGIYIYIYGEIYIYIYIRGDISLTFYHCTDNVFFLQFLFRKQADVPLDYSSIISMFICFGNINGVPFDFKIKKK